MILGCYTGFPDLFFTDLYWHACDSTHDPASDIT